MSSWELQRRVMKALTEGKRRGGRQRVPSSNITDQFHPTMRFVFDIMFYFSPGPGIPLVQFRTVQLSDGKLQLQRRKACLVITDDTPEGAVQVCRLHANGEEVAIPVVVHTTMRIGQIQRVLHQIETTTLQKAVTEPPGPNEKDSRPVNRDECFSLIYGCVPRSD